MKKFKCDVCGYEYESEEAVVCPICAAPVEEQHEID